jgi:outer membrane protein assembly factor BamB
MYQSSAGRVWFTHPEQNTGFFQRKFGCHDDCIHERRIRIFHLGDSDSQKMNKRNLIIGSVVVFMAILILTARGTDSVRDENDVPPDVSGSVQTTEQPGYRASLYGTTWPVDMANLNRSNTVVNAGLPQGFTCEEVHVDTVEMPFPVFAYTRDIDEVFVLGGLPMVLDKYVSDIDGQSAGSSPTQPHLTKYNPQTGETIQLDLTMGNEFPYIGGAMVHENGYVYVVSQAYLYKINPDSMTIAAGRELPKAPFPGNFVTIYNGLSTSSSGELLTKFFTPLSRASTFFSIDPDTLEINATVDYPGASPRLTVHQLDNGEEYLYHLNRFTTFRFRIHDGELTLDEEWLSPFDPYETGEEENEEPTSPVIAQGRVHYTTNTMRDAEEPMRIFWQEIEVRYSPDDPPLSGEALLSGPDGPGWSFFHLAIDDVSGMIVAVDQGAGALVAVKIRKDGTLERLWQKPYTVSARPVIVSDREYVYATDYAQGCNYLVVLDLHSGEELCRVATPANRATVATIIVSAANEVYFGSNEPGRETGLFHRFYVP